MDDYNTFVDFGIDLPRSSGGEVQTTCPQCSHTRRKSLAKCLAVHLTKGVWFCHHCGWKGCLKSRLTYDRSNYSSAVPLPSADQRKREAIRRTWIEAQPVTVGDPVDTYLRNRNLVFEDLAAIPSVLRYHPNLRYYHDNRYWECHPAMVAKVHDQEVNSVSLHRTYLSSDGCKAEVPTPRKLMSPPTPGATRGGAIRLYSPTDILAVAEGIETALAVHLATELPVWAAISAGGMAALVIPETVGTVVICADHDDAGLKAARVLARRMLLERRSVKMLTPDTPGMDWADAVEVCHG